MKFEFAKYTEVTTLAHSLDPDYKANGYTRIFLCPDVNDIWLARILPNHNIDYDPFDGIFILERNNIQKPFKGMELTKKIAEHILLTDDFSSWDFIECFSEEECIENLEDGFGINLETNG